MIELMQNATNNNANSSPTTGRSFYGRGKFRWAIYPDYWKEKWGRKPLLGHVYADDEFYAIREAYNRGLLTVNMTIQPEPVKVGVAKARPSYQQANH